MTVGTAGTLVILVICTVTLLAVGWAMNNREHKTKIGPAPISVQKPPSAQ